MSVAEQHIQRRAATSLPEWLQRGRTRLRLQTMVRLRWLAILGQSATVVGVYWVLGIDLPIAGCLIAIACSAWLNVALRLVYPASQRLPSRAALLMLAYDILQMAALLYLTGGLENPFSFLLVAPVTVSAATQPPRVTLALGALTILLASLLTVYHHPLPWFEPGGLQLPFYYVLGIWATVVSGLMFIGFYSWRTAEEGRRMAEALAAAEMVLAREQRLSALDGLAAAAAHGLGTPLATISVVSKELLRDVEEGDPRHDDLALLRSQAERCREILAQLAAKAEQNDLIVSRMPVTQLMEEVVAPHRLVTVPIEIKTGPPPGVEPETPAAREPVMQRNPGVLYGLGNLIENAIDFAANKVETEAVWTADEVRITIADDGTGFPADVLEQLGEPFVTTRPSESWGEEAPDEHIGMGLGFFIAKTLLERSGARLKLANRDKSPGGAVVTVIWPRARFEEPWQ
ncbi:ActS/PrrB/RegB family redox-sensitive histidine kinase [Methyloligella sp. 2.7D]|uniref:ActS/PrrB/RegB family redox-sensitive histidine kinase n=1 Tax=unclassified Methyloligella TaxID=2625955 RepID=UPI00157E0034|nr:ActS/PrrB/RegB family redox-sensitive histidine kinase [Methyloligella sp. GL2]QKP76035.1 ActS/PrrB/RegB family redox-sensitive histidine kinase [Methyloligella sp. GL2]